MSHHRSLGSSFIRKVIKNIFPFTAAMLLNLLTFLEKYSIGKAFNRCLDPFENLAVEILPQFMKHKEELITNGLLSKHSVSKIHTVQKMENKTS